MSHVIDICVLLQTYIYGHSSNSSGHPHLIFSQDEGWGTSVFLYITRSPEVFVESKRTYALGLIKTLNNAHANHSQNLVSGLVEKQEDVTVQEYLLDTIISSVLLKNNFQKYILFEFNQYFLKGFIVIVCRSKKFKCLWCIYMFAKIS